MKEPIAQSSALPGNAQDFAIGAFIGLHGYKKNNNRDYSSWGLI